MAISACTAALEFPFEEAEEEGAVEAVGYSIDYSWVGVF